MAKLRTLVIRTDGGWVIGYNEVTLDWLQKQVDGYIEPFTPHPARIGGEPWVGYCNEEGKMRNLPLNEPATRAARILGWDNDDTLCGDVVILGDDGDEETDLPDWVVSIMCERFYG